MRWKGFWSWLEFLESIGIPRCAWSRIRQHKDGTFDGFTKRYKINLLMYFEMYSDSKLAEFREKQIKKYRREKKIALFKSSNPQWKDLTPELFVSIGIPRYARDFRTRPAAGDQHSQRPDQP